MNEFTDQNLLREYAERRSETAFAELVRRHVDLVYSAALRMVCDSHLAQDVTQSAFLALARSAGQLTECAVLSSWLHRTAQNIAAQTVRTDVRRRAREQNAAAMNALTAAGAGDVWEHVAPQLDATLAELNEADRDALLLRYFERKSALEMARILGVSEEAAQKRVTRAVERLRELFASRGVSVATNGLAVVLSANAVQAAPVGLALTISTAAALTGTTLVSTAAATTAKTFAMTTTQKCLTATFLAAAIGTGIYENHRATRLRTDIAALRDRETSLNDQIQQLTTERDEGARRLSNAPTNDQPLNRALTELLKLRGEVARLKADSAAATNEDPTHRAAKAWLTRVNQLKEYLRQHPEKSIPEVQLITERDWLSVVANRDWLSTISKDVQGSDAALSEAEYKSVLTSLYSMSKMRFSQKASAALRSYELTHDRQFPTDVSQLKPHFTEPIDDSILQRYAVQPKSNFGNVRVEGDWVLAEIGSPEETADRRYLIGSKGTDTVPFTEDPAVQATDERQARLRALVQILEPLAKAYAEAHEGRPPPAPENLSAYAATPEQQSALQRLIELRKEVAPKQP